MPAFLQQLDHRAGQPQLPLHRLVAIGGGADGQPPRLIGFLRQLRAQHRGDVALGDDLRFEVQPRRHVQVAVGRPRVAVDAAVLAAPVGIDRSVEVDVRRIVGADHAACVFPDHFGPRGRSLGLLDRAPAVVVIEALVLLEAVRQPRGRAAALDRFDWDADFSHGAF
jgi:hypothetical protein